MAAQDLLDSIELRNVECLNQKGDGVGNVLKQVRLHTHRMSCDAKTSSLLELWALRWRQPHLVSSTYCSRCCLLCAERLLTIMMASQIFCSGSKLSCQPKNL